MVIETRGEEGCDEGDASQKGTDTTSGAEQPSERVLQSYLDKELSDFVSLWWPSGALSQLVFVLMGLVTGSYAVTLLATHAISLC